MTYRVGIDSGGTFMDFVALSSDGRRWIHKASSDPTAPSRVMLDGLGGLADKVGVDLAEFLASCEVIIHGTTVALNALLQQRSAKTGLLSTAGHQDSLEIRLGHKEDGHRWDFSFPAAPPLVPAYLRLPVRERVLSDGAVFTALDEEQVREQVRVLKDNGVEAVAVSCLWSFLHPGHEERIAELVREELPDCFLSLSSRVLPRVREYPRTSTTALNASIGPILERYMRDIEGRLREHGFAGAIYYMQSNGGVGTREILNERPVAALNSGPAGGPVAALQFARLLGKSSVISIDMGGTSFDVCLVRDGLPDIVTDVDVARYRSGLPMVNVTSIGAGGGSIATIDERGVLQVGPASAEANPGPACYDRGGVDPTVTDALVVLGYLPQNALVGGAMSIKRPLAEAAIQRELAEPLGISVEKAAQGVVDLTASNMVEGIRVASIERGHDPRDFVLVAGGGAGPLFAGLLARELAIETVVVPKVAGVLCAFGEAVADLRYDAVRSYPTTLGSIDHARANALFEEMEAEGRAALLEAGATDVRVARMAEMKYADQMHYCDVAVPSGHLGPGEIAELRTRFDAKHEQLYTYSEPDNEAEILSLGASVIVGASGSGDADSSAESAATAVPGPGATRRVLLPGSDRSVDVPVFDGARLSPDAEIHGPAIIEEETTTTVVFPDSVARLDSRGFYLMEVAPVTEVTPARRREGSHVDPVTLAVVQGALEATQRAMTQTMERSARSPIQTIARDHSNALFDWHPRMILQGEDLPTHLGSLIMATKAVAAYFEGDIYPGDVLFHNDPYYDGSHVVDWCTYKPIFFEGELVFWAVSKGHVTDTGGAVPGSYNMNAREIYAEGLRIPPIKLVDRGVPRRDVINLLLTNVRSRKNQQGDLNAQFGAVTVAEQRLVALLQKYGLPTVRACVERLLDLAEAHMRSIIARLPDGSYKASVVAEDTGHGGGDQIISAVATVASDEVKISFEAPPQLAYYTNSPRSNTQSGVNAGLLMFAQVQPPFNEGLYRPVTVDFGPPGTMVNPVEPAPHVNCTGGPQETVCDVVRIALTKADSSRPHAGWSHSWAFNVAGTNPRTGQPYVQSIVSSVVGGAGAVGSSDGWDACGPQASMGALQTGDTELVELSLPIVVHRLQIACDSGGPGRWRGGCGLITEIEPLDHETEVIGWGEGAGHPPAGVLGAEPVLVEDKLARGWHVRGDDEVMREVRQNAIFTVKPGERYISRSQGGAGAGDPRSRPPELVRADVQNRKVSVRGAEVEYGVVLDPVTLEIDVDATRERRLEGRVRGDPGCVNSERRALRSRGPGGGETLV